MYNSHIAIPHTRPQSIPPEQVLWCRHPARINDIERQRRGITADTTLRLARHFGTSAKFWMTLQKSYELEVAARRFSPAIARRIKPARIKERACHD